MINSLAKSKVKEKKVIQKQKRANDYVENIFQKYFTEFRCVST